MIDKRRDLKPVEIPDFPLDALTAHNMREERAENAWRREAITTLLQVFYVLNGAVLLFILLCWCSELISARASKMLSEKTLLALIAGSTAQLGALAVSVGGALAPKPQNLTQREQHVAE